jgi:ribulose-phosphate 3-epimerase
MLEAHKVLIAPSILSADFMRLGESLDAVRGADLIHFDVMDGHFVPNLSFGPGLLKAVKGYADALVDAHLMVSNPDEVVGDYLKAGADIVSFHIEAARHALRIVDEIHAAGAKASVALNPGTSVATLDALIDHIDMVLIMSVNPGFGGQSFIEGTYGQLRRLMALCEEHGVRPLVEVDGGVSAANAAGLVAAGVDVLVAGSAVFGADDPAAAITAIRAEGLRGASRPS